MSVLHTTRTFNRVNLAPAHATLGVNEGTSTIHRLPDNTAQPAVWPYDGRQNDINDAPTAI